MSNPMISENAESCVWMSAGLLDYKLCDRAFDCERCPLDAALRGHSLDCPVRRVLMGPSSLSSVFPEDRLYSTSHTWVQDREIDGDRVLRLGIDTFAAAIIGHCDGIRWNVFNQTRRLRETLCEIDLGIGFLPLGAPICAVVVNGNRALQDDPSQLVTAPYGEGWIVDLAVDNTAEIPGMLRAEAAREQSGLDLRRFRRRVALHLFEAMDAVGPSLADGGELLTDLRQMLGGSNYLALLRDLVH